MMIHLRYAFLMLLTFPVVFSECSKDQESKRKGEIIHKLCSLGEIRPVKCTTEAENMKIQGPKIPHQDESRQAVLEMSFRVVSELLMNNVSTEWKSNELQQLQDLLGHQNQFYSKCVPALSSARAEVDTWSTFWRRLSDYLSEKSFSSCSWESARTVILQVMRSLYRSASKSPRPIRSC